MPRESQGLLICGVSWDLFYGKELDTLKRGGRRVEQRHREPGVGAGGPGLLLQVPCTLEIAAQ